MAVVFRYPSRPPWLYPAGTVIRTKFGRFRVCIWSDPNSGFSMREWRVVSATPDIKRLVETRSQ